MVRIPQSALHTLRVHHAATTIDPSVVVPEGLVCQPDAQTLGGHTRWEGHWQAAPVFASWNWGVLLRSLVVINPHRIETNIQLVANSGEISRLLNRARIFEWIESLPWRDSVKQVIAQRSPDPPAHS